ncbi:MAG: hypothetical protein H5T61_05865 [Thermoflexales bacterium]|nr:hypothetical protein [Thermoflexales bacterium]
MGKTWLNLKRRISQELNALDRDTQTIIGICLAAFVLIANFLLFVTWRETGTKLPVIMTLCVIAANVWLGSVGFYYSCDTWKEMRAFRLNAKETTGRVVKVESNCWDDIGLVYYPIIEYEAEGRVYVLRHHLYSAVVNRYKLGDIYRLVYCPERPGRAEFYPYPVWKKGIKLFVYGLAGVMASGSLVGLLCLSIFPG